MSNPSQSLTCLLDWSQVFQAIDLEVPRRCVLPQSMRCPHCESGTLTIMQDFVLHSQWFYCHGCRFAGDLIELAAKLMDRPIPLAIEYLKSQSLFSRQVNETDLSNYLTEQVGYRSQINTFWNAASQVGAPFGALGKSGYRLLCKFQMDQNVMQAAWAEREGRFFGVSSRERVEELFFPQSFAVQMRSNHPGKFSCRRGGGPGKRRLFEGQDWDEVIVIPHSDLPGRIIGFTFIGGNIDDPAVVYKRANIGNCVNNPRESGLGFLNAIDESSSLDFKSVAFVFGDAKLVTLLHARNFRESQQPLPVLLAHQSRDFRVLNLPPDLADRKVICCGPLMETLPLAKSANAMVSLYQISDAETRDSLKHNLLYHWLRLYQRKAVPWVTALRHQMDNLQPADLDILLSRMNLTADQCRCLVRGLGESAGERLAHSGSHRIGRKSIIVRGQTIIECENGWSIRRSRKDESICNWPIRIERVYRMRSGDDQYEVSVHCSKEPVKLIIAQNKLKSSTLFDLVSDELEVTGNHHLQYAVRKWAKESFSIAMKFSEPQFVNDSDRVGWVPDRHRFQFPKFSILNNGDVDSKPMPIHDRSCPATDLSAPLPCREFVALLSRISAETQIIWALAACITHNLLVGNCLREPLGVILDGRYARETGVNAAHALGCGEVDVADRGKAKISDYVSSRCGAHDFPTVVNFGAHSEYRISATWLDDPSLRQAVLPLPSCTAIAVSSHQGFVRICMNDHPQPLGRLTLAAQWIIPSYLEDLCHRKKQFRAWDRDNSLLTVLGDLAEWFERAGGNPKAVLAAQKVLTFDSRSLAMAFVELAEQMRDSSKIRFASPVGHTPGSARIPIAVIDRQLDAGWPQVMQVNTGTMNEVLRKNFAPAIHLDDVQSDLVTQAAWHGIVPTEHGDDWLIRAEWWTRQINTIRRKLRGIL